MLWLLAVCFSQLRKENETVFLTRNLIVRDEYVRACLLAASRTPKFRLFGLNSLKSPNFELDKGGDMLSRKKFGSTGVKNRTLRNLGPRGSPFHHSDFR